MNTSSLDAIEVAAIVVIVAIALYLAGWLFGKGYFRVKAKYHEELIDKIKREE